MMRVLTPTLMLLGLLFAGTANPAYPRASEGGAISRESTGWRLLEEIQQAAPARQVGQPGNRVVQTWLEETFQDYARRHNNTDSRPWEAASQTYQNALDALMESHGNLYLDEIAVLRKPWTEATMEAKDSGGRFERLLLTPTPLYLILSGALCMVAVAWWFQRRSSFLWVGAGLILLLGIVAVASATLQNQAIERLQTDGPDATEIFRSKTTAFLEAAQALRDGGKGHWRHGHLTYSTAAFVPGEATLETGAKRARVYQLAPNLTDPANLPQPTLEAPLVYINPEHFDTLREVDLSDSIALMEFNSGRQWLAAVEAGAEAVIFLEPSGEESLSFHQATLKTSNSPLSIPRFYLTREDADRLFGDTSDLGKGTAQSVRLVQEAGRWKRMPVHAHWIHIPAANPDAAGDLVHIQSYFDAASIVPERSPGAASTLNLAAVKDLLEAFSHTAPDYPVLISVVNDHANALNGEFVFSSMAFTPADLFAEELERIDHLRSQHLLVKEIYSRETGPQLLDYLRGAIERVAGRSYTVKEPVVNYLTMRRNTLRGEQNLLAFELTSSDLTEVERNEINARRNNLNENAAEVVALLGLFNRFGHQTHWDEITPAQREALARILHQLAENASREAASLDLERRRIWNNMAFRNELAATAVPAAADSLAAITTAAFPALPVLAAFNLDLAAGSEELGFFHIGEIRKYIGNDRFAEERIRRLSRLTLDMASELRAEHPTRNDTLPTLRDTVLQAGGLHHSAHLATKSAFGSQAFHQFAKPALTLTTVDDQHAVAFTPDDTLAHLNRDRVERILDFSQNFFTRLVNDPRLADTVQTRTRSEPPLAVELTVRKMDRFSVGVPRTVLSDAVILGFPRQRFAQTEPAVNLGQVRPFPILMADDFGRQTLRGELWRHASLMAFGYDQDFRKVVAAVDMGDNERRFSSTLALTTRTHFAHRSIVTFKCEKSDLLGWTHPLTLQPISEIELLDGRNDTRPRHFSVAGISAQGSGKSIPLSFDSSASVFLQPDMPYKLKAGKVIALNTTPDNLYGTGFPIATRTVRNMPRIMANDYQRLAAANIDLLTSKGVSADTAETYNDEAGIIMDRLSTIQNPGAQLPLTEVSRGLSFRAYGQTVDIISDLVQAAIILLALIVPFCFFLVKLLSPYTDINRQILIFMAVFALFALLLYFIQPAFHVGDHPEVVILAFVILGLAGFVGSIIVGRFNATMTQAVEQSQLSESVDAPQGRLAGVAFMVGVNNMKRRRIRTTLTCATIVLVTFTILSVISVRQGAEPLRLKTGGEAPYNGLLISNPGFAPIEPLQLDRLRSHFEGHAVTVARTWTSRQDKFGSYMPFRIQPREIRPHAKLKELEALIVLGLETDERDFLAPLESPEYLTPGSRWFADNHAEEVIISRQAGAFLGLSDEDVGNSSLVLNGRDYLLVGLFQDTAFEKLLDLRKHSLLPLKVDPTQGTLTDTLSATTDITRLPGVTTASPLEVAVFPIDTARTLGPTTNRSLAVKYSALEGEDAAGTATRLWHDAQQFLRFQDAYLGVGLTGDVDRGPDRPPLDPGEYTIASASAAEIGGGLKIAIPIILAATIILNTMLGSVMERKKEISIYNAIGLNPTHVMVFFLAEALVFGLVGSVAGYFIGQVLSVGFGRFMDINLNYSSLSVMVVIFLTIATVMLSTVYPAMLAARAAVPSGQRKWSLPRPDGDEIHLKFPFSYDAQRVLGICTYLKEFMQQNSEASTGKFLARLRATGKVPDENNGEALALVYAIAPTPFDLGVNQQMEIYASYDRLVRAYMLSVHLTRESGDRDSWLTVNQPFLEALRKRLLAWRSQRPEIQDTYCRTGEALFKNAATLPLRPAHSPKEDSQ